MTGLDTNLLLYALNADAPENAAARAFLDGLRDDPDVVLSELVLVELYVLLRNRAVIARPLGAGQAATLVQGFRRHPSWQLVDHEPSVMGDVWRLAATDGFARTRIFDVRLAFGLLHRGVRRFATRNVRDFEELGFDEVFDPLAAPAG